MSDSYKPEVQFQGSITEFLDALCEGTSVSINDITSDAFPKGWVNILRVFIEAVQYDTNHYSLNVNFGELELSNEQQYLDAEKYHILKAMRELQLSAKETCMQCGGEGKKMINGKTVMVFCRTCRSKVKKQLSKATGTWLDNY